MRRITFSADGDLIDEVRAVAKRNQRSLAVEFREWLAGYVESGSKKKLTFRELMQQLGEVKIDRKYSRDEMNERR